MIALVRYDLSMLVRGQSYIAPFVLYASAIVTLTTNDQGPLPRVYTASAMTIFICMLWLTVALINTEEPAQRAMTSVAARGEHRVLAANVLAALVICLALTALGLIYPIPAGDHTWSSTDLVIGIVAQLTCGVTGIAGGLVCSRIVVRRTGYAVFLALGLIGVFTLIRVLPPVAPTMVILGSDRPATEMVTPLLLNGVIAVVLLAGSTIAAYQVARRQE
ncbi:hypothetical protein AB0M02_21255 [Actinoplanes sp. NPDC051861]|uniref:hypothetical protein n=1 Tax=Actinoplanes sp. NPDC051861 TaxID=3155170 RepID=UPI003442436E